MREIVWRLDEDLDGRFSCIHFDGDFGIPEIDLVAASVSPPENSMCHVCPSLAEFYPTRGPCSHQSA